MRSQEAEQLPDARLPTQWANAVFRAKSTLLRVRRWRQDVTEGVPRHRQRAERKSEFPYLLAESRTPLWTSEKLSERRLQRGKAHNLRAAVCRLNGAIIPVDGVFSFWKQVGRATPRRGFTQGRELREGCIIPAVGGGLCQLSNALYDAALRTGVEVIERHPHTRIVPGSLAAKGRDATVAWNYIDLRFRFAQETFVTAFLTSDELVIQFRATAPSAKTTVASAVKRRISLLDPSVQSCENCGETGCFRHSDAEPGSDDETAFLVDTVWPEYWNYVRKTWRLSDAFFSPTNGARWKLPRYDWGMDDFSVVHTASGDVLRNSIAARFARRGGPATLRAAQLLAHERIARQFARALMPEQTHLVIAQSLLPFLWRDGHLGGRTFDVLMQRLPLSVLHSRLDEAFTQFPDRALLGDFRAPAALISLEKDALQAARRIVTPHAEIADLFGTRAMRLPWQIPFPIEAKPSTNAPVIIFPGPTSARKGAWEVRAAACALGATVLLLGSELEGSDFWNGVTTRHAMPGEAWWEAGGVVVQPSLVEDAPRNLLRALAAGLPVVTTRGSGLAPCPKVHFVPFGDVDALTHAISRYYAL